MTTSKNSKTIGTWTIVCTLAISFLLLVSLFNPQEACADKKKITGTSEGVDLLARARIPVPKSPVKGSITACNMILDSDDPAWNKAGFYFAEYLASTGEWNYKGFGVITHPGGDQTFIEFEQKRTGKGGVYIGEVSGFFLKGTGKFKGIKGSWNSNWERVAGKNRLDKWVAEYEIK